MGAPTMSDARMAELYLDGMTLKQVGQAAGTSKVTVAAHLKAAGVHLRPGGTRPGFPRPTRSQEADARARDAASRLMLSDIGKEIGAKGRKAARTKAARAKVSEKLKTGNDSALCAWCGEKVGYRRASHTLRNGPPCCDRRHASLAHNRPMQAHYYRSQVRPEFWRMQRDLGLTDRETFEAAGVDLPYRSVTCEWCGAQFETFNGRIPKACSDQCRVKRESARDRARRASK